MKIIALLSLVAITVLAGCAAPLLPEERIQAKVEEQERRAEKIARQGFEVGEQIDKIVFPRFLDSWGYIDDSTIWVESRPKRYYLITTQSPCRELNFSQAIAFRSTTGTYLMEHDEILVDREPSINCRIDLIYEMTRPSKSRDEE